jgi:hypothetical protein
MWWFINFPSSIFRNEIKEFDSELILTDVNKWPLNGNNVSYRLCTFTADTENKIYFKYKHEHFN